MHQYFWEVCFYGKQIINFNLKGFCYSFAWSCSLCEGRTNFYMGLMSWKLWVFLLMFLTGFTSLSVLFLFLYHSPFCLYARFLMLFHLTWVRFSWSTHLPMCLSLETLTCIVGTGWHILVVLIELVNSIIIFLTQITLLGLVNFLTWIPDCDCHSPALLDLFLLTLVFVLKWVSLQWEILTWSCFSFHWLSIKLKMGCPISLHSLWLFFWWFWWAS